MEGRWSVGNLVALAAFVSVVAMPWVYLARGPEAGFVDLLIISVIWLVIGTFAAANATDWRKRNEQRGK